MFDVTIIGSGVVGCSIAREMSKYNLKVCVLDKDSDIGAGTTKANSAIIHAGFDAKSGSLKGKLNAIGNTMFDKLAEELDFPFKRVGSLVLCFDKNDMNKLEDLKIQGEKNGVPNLEVLDGDKVREMEPSITDEVVAALYAPTGGIVCPYFYLCRKVYYKCKGMNYYKYGSEAQFDIKSDAVNNVPIIPKDESVSVKIDMND